MATVTLDADEVKVLEELRTRCCPQTSKSKFCVQVGGAACRRRPSSWPWAGMGAAPAPQESAWQGGFLVGACGGG
jgi:hypothetical protein